MARPDDQRALSDRTAWLRVLAVGCFLVLGSRLIYLQVIRADTFTRLAETQRIRRSPLFPARGSLYLSERGSDRPVLVATTRLAPTAYLVPRDVSDREKTAEVLAAVVQQHEERARARRDQLLLDTGQLTVEERESRVSGTSGEAPSPKVIEDAARQRREELAGDLLRRLSNRADPYEPILSGGERLDAVALEELRKADVPGVEFRDVLERAYPEETLAAHLLGFVRGDGAAARGEYGLEAGLDGVLRGFTGFRTSERDVAGRLISLGDRPFIPVEHGADVVLTIDRVLQSAAERLAREGRERFRADRAQVVIMDPNTGAVLALAAFPTFDPNTPNAIRSLDVFKNPVMGDLVEPGSVLKPAVMAAALEHGLVTPDTTAEDRGPVRIGKYTINTYDGKHHGTVTMTEVLEQSNNIGMVWVAQRVGAERLYQFFRRLGIGDRSGLPLVGEAGADLPPAAEWGDTRTATIGFGQGLVMTPFEVLIANAALINGGRLVAPHLVREVRYPGGRIAVTEPKVIRQVIRPEVSETVRAMLTSVVEKGVAVRARVPGYYVGGKTGTAQVTDPKTGRYSPDDKIISFVGFAPSDRPEFIALVKLDNPAGLSFASGTAAPLFSRLAQQTLEYLRIPSTRLTSREIRRR